MQDADFIEGNGVNSTVDLWFFSVTSNAIGTIQIDDRSNPPNATADPDLIIYLDDGTFSNVFASDTAAGTDPMLSNIAVGAGSYIAVVANHFLSVGEFGPFKPDAVLNLASYEYEFSVTGALENEFSFDCLNSGNLAGGYDKKVFTGGSDTCSLPPGQVSEPSGFMILAFAMAGLAWAAWQNQRRTPQDIFGA